ncbi:hypothetical protein WT98_17100 [Burkholderia territorii]|nr:hypothetical protein WT98_17100 [Burkholderia territorii]
MLAKRADHRTWLLEFERQLVRAGGAGAIIEAMTSVDFQLRRAAYFVARDHQLLSVIELVERGLRSGDIVLARSAVTFLDQVPISDRAACVTIGMMSSFGTIRDAAFRFAINHRVDSNDEQPLWLMLFDSQGSLRSAAASLLVSRGRDVVGHCTMMLDTGRLNVRQVCAGLSLLVELGVPEAIRILEKYVADGRTEVRARALTLQARVAPSLKDEIASAALLDSSRKVRKIGVVLCAQGAFVSLDTVEMMLARHMDYRAALTVCAREQWDTVACIAMIAASQTPNTSDHGDLRDALGKWISDRVSSWTNPSVRHREILSRPDVGSRLFELAGDRRQALQVRLQEGGIEL